MKKPKHIPLSRFIIWLIVAILSLIFWLWLETPTHPLLSFLVVLTIAAIWLAVELFSLQRSVNIDPRLNSYSMFYIISESSYKRAMVLALYLAVVPLVTLVDLLTDQEIRLLIADYFEEINSLNIFLIIAFVSFFYTMSLYSDIRTRLLLNRVQYSENFYAQKEEEEREG